MKFSLLWILMVTVLASALSVGCKPHRKVEQIREGIENVDQYAKKIKEAAEPRP